MLSRFSFTKLMNQGSIPVSLRALAVSNNPTYTDSSQKLMNTKFACYTLAAIITGSILPAVAISDRAVALDQGQAPRPNTSAQIQSEMSRSNEVDKSFIEMMVPHHQSADQMAEIALKRAKNPEVRRLAQSIIDDQTK